MKCHLTVLALMFGSAANAGTVVFSEDFSDGTASAEISGDVDVIGVDGYSGIGGFANNFLWNDSNAQPTLLSLNGLSAHSTINISFELAVIDSWDNEGAPPFAPDYFNLELDGTSLAKVSFFNFDAGTTTLPDGITELQGPTENLIANSRFSDSAYSVSITAVHSGPTANFALFADGSGWQGGVDESWAVDNISVSIGMGPEVVPLPASLPMLAAGIIGLGFWRRKQQKNA